MSRTAKSLLLGIPVILFLLAVAIPNFMTPRMTVSMNACANNLRWLDYAKKQWALQDHKRTNDLPAESDLLPFLHPGDKIPRCPSGGTYTVGRIGEPPKCSVGGVGHTLFSD